YQRIQSPGVSQLLHGFHADIGAGFFEELGEPGNRRAATLADFANVLGTNILSRQCGDNREDRKTGTHIEIRRYAHWKSTKNRDYRMNSSSTFLEIRPASKPISSSFCAASGITSPASTVK